MGWYAEHVLPRLVEASCGTAGLEGWRRRTTDGLAGRVVEIGFGSGLNLAHYPSSVTEILAVEPSSVARRRARRRLDACPIPVRYVGLDGQELSLDDRSCDAALVTFTLCTIPDPLRALLELRRVLRPGGELHFLEHGLADDARVAVWQQRLDHLEVRLAGGCHLTRSPAAMVGDAGFELRWVDAAHAPGPKPWTFLTCGVGTTGR